MSALIFPVGIIEERNKHEPALAVQHIVTALAYSKKAPESELILDCGSLFNLDLLKNSS